MAKNLLLAGLGVGAALALILTLGVSAQSVFAADQTKTLVITVVDDETGNKVAGATCVVTDDVGDSTATSTDSGGRATVTLDKDATVAFVDVCVSGAGGSAPAGPIPLRDSGNTPVTIVI